MADYNSSYTGAQIDANIGKVANADTTPTSGSTDMITSGAVYTANQVALTAAASAQSTADAALPKAGGIMTGNVNMGDNSITNTSQITMSTGGRITNLSTATDAQTAYAASVAYVLAKISASFAQFAAAVLAVALTGLSTATNAAVEATDTILVGIGKLQAQITALISTVGTNTSNISTNASNISSLSSTKANIDNPTFTTKISTPIVQASTSGGLSLKNNAGTEVALLGAGGGTGTTFAGQINGTSISLSAGITSKQFIATSATLTDGASIDWNLALGNVAVVTLGGNRTMNAPTNLAVGTYLLKVIQDGTGSRTITWNSVFKWTGGTAPTLSTTASAIDVISFYCDGTNLYSSTNILNDVK